MEYIQIEPGYLSRCSDWSMAWMPVESEIDSH
jgi:hypothetical protein